MIVKAIEKIFNRMFTDKEVKMRQLFMYDCKEVFKKEFTGLKAWDYSTARSEAQKVVNSEEFIDKIIERIMKKQLKQP